MRSVADARPSAARGTGGRELQAIVLEKAVNRMRSCRYNWDGSLTAALVEALDMNRAIWTVFRGELLAVNSPLPQPMRVNLLKLSHIVDHVTSEMMAEPVADRLELLIDINTGIAEGLFGRPESNREPLTLCA